MVSRKLSPTLAIVDDSGLSYQLGPMRTVIEGETEQVLDVILRCHHRVLELAPRVLTNIALDDRKGAVDRLRGKVRMLNRFWANRFSVTETAIKRAARTIFCEISSRLSRRVGFQQKPLRSLDVDDIASLRTLRLPFSLI